MSTSERIANDSTARAGPQRPDDDLRHSNEHIRTSTEIREEDRHILSEDEEAEELLRGGRPVRSPRKLFGRGQFDNGKSMESKHDLRGNMQHKRKRRRLQGYTEEENGGLLFEMEEGANRSSSSESLGDSGEMDRQKLVGIQRSVQVGH